MRNAYLHGSGKWTNDLIAVSRAGLMPSGAYYTLPDAYAVARVKRNDGVLFTPASVGHAVRVPLDNESRISLNTLCFGTNLNLIARDYSDLRLSVIDNDSYVRASFSYDEILLLSAWAMYYVTLLNEHADAIAAGDVSLTDPWPDSEIPPDFTMWPGATPSPPAGGFPPVGGCTWVFGMGQTVVNGTLYVDVPYAYRLDSMIANVGSAAGSFVVTASINGTNVTGLAGITVNGSTDTPYSATAANIGTAGQIKLAISSTSGAPTDSKIILRWTRIDD